MEPGGVEGRISCELIVVKWLWPVALHGAPFEAALLTMTFGGFE